MSRNIGFALIGCGVISTRHAEEIATIEGAELVAVADVDRDKAKALSARFSVDWYVDYQEMLKRDDVDVVNILTPSGMHAEMASDAARAGKHVVVEKPMDIHLHKAKAMVQACRDAGVKLSIISQHLFDRSTIRVKEEIEQGSLGNMVLGQAAIHWYRSQEYYDSGDWRGTWALDGGGVLMNQGIHTIDILQHLMGSVESVYAHTATLAHERIEVEDVAVATLKFQNGALGTIVGTTSAYPGFSARLELFGTNGSAIINNDILTHLYIRKEGEQGAMYGRGPAENLADISSASESAGASSEPAAISGFSHRIQILDMINAIHEDREPFINGEKGLKPLEIVLAIYKSAETGQPVFLTK